LHEVGPAVYVAFFTLTGVSLKLDILLSTLPIAVALFLVRMAAIFIGSYLGGLFAGEPQSFRRYAWLGLITQAGIALGLSREVAVEFPILGDSFATLIIAVVVLNEIFGPIFLKFALQRVGETNLPQPRKEDEVRDVVILGIEEQSIELGRQLQKNNWRVIMADIDESHVDRLFTNGIGTLHIPEISQQVIAGLVPPTANIDAVVILLEDDDLNYEACRIAAENFGVSRLVVRVNDFARAEAFTALGALVVDQASAMVNLLDQSVRAPQSTALLLHQDAGRELVQVTVSNPDVAGMYVRDLRLPQDVLFLDVTRNGQSIVPNGYTRLHLMDEITLLGRLESLEEATLKIGY
jgi:Trk K+ transport system NAD-binding subunit